VVSDPDEAAMKNCAMGAFDRPNDRRSRPRATKKIRAASRDLKRYEGRTEGLGDLSGCRAF
jgi:hypothetical protein